MTEEKPFTSAKITLGFAIVSTCLTFIYIFYTVLGVYGFYGGLFGFIIFTVFSASLWVEAAKREEKLSKKVSNYIQAGLLIVTCILIGVLVTSYFLLPP